MIITSR